jgi:hypothetical protein
VSSNIDISVAEARDHHRRSLSREFGGRARTCSNASMRLR